MAVGETGTGQQHADPALEKLEATAQALPAADTTTTHTHPLAFISPEGLDACQAERAGPGPTSTNSMEDDTTTIAVLEATIHGTNDSTPTPVVGGSAVSLVKPCTGSDLPHPFGRRRHPSPHHPPHLPGSRMCSHDAQLPGIQESSALDKGDVLVRTSSKQVPAQRPAPTHQAWCQREFAAVSAYSAGCDASYMPTTDDGCGGWARAFACHVS